MPREGADSRIPLRQRIALQALKREIRRLRQLLELEDDAYSDLIVLKRARQELQELWEGYDDQ